MTARAKATEHFAQSVVVHEMSQDEGVSFLLRRAVDKPRNKQGEVCDYPFVDKWDAEELVNTLGALPLALDQTGAYIRETQCDLAGYLDRYQTHGHGLLQERGTLFSDQDHPESVAITWLLSFEKIAAENPMAIEILRLSAFLHPDNMPEEIFQEDDVLALDKALKVILKYSFVKRDPKTKILVVHRLVQMILRHEMDEATRRDWAEKAMRAVNHVFPSNIEVSEWATCERLLPCAQTCAELIEEWELESEEAGLLLNKIGYYLIDRKAEYEQAKPLYERALAMSEKVLGKEHPSVATSLNNLAGLYDSQGDYEQAKPLYERALKILKKFFKPDHPHVRTVSKNYAILLEDMKKPTKASKGWLRKWLGF